MKPFILAYIVSGIAFLALDFVWLGIMGNALYRPQLGNLLLEKFLLLPAAAFYLLYPVGIAVFAVSPGLQSGSPLSALGHGLLLGLIAYATYDLTNMATLRSWSPLVSLADLAWGSIASGVAAGIACWVIKLLAKA